MTYGRSCYVHRNIYNVTLPVTFTGNGTCYEPILEETLRLTFFRRTEKAAKLLAPAMNKDEKLQLAEGLDVNDLGGLLLPPI